MSEYHIEITDHQKIPLVDHDFLRRVISQVLQAEMVAFATISLALVNDVEIHRVNREFLGHDYPTDVISFLLDHDVDRSADVFLNRDCGESTNSPPIINSQVQEHRSDLTETNFSSSKASCVNINGELIVSTDTAIREAASHGWSPDAELLLYLIHGLLHLCGYDDLTDEARPVMRSRERELLALWGFCPTGLEP